MRTSKHIITSGIDGGTHKVLGYADDMCDALNQIERLLGGRENAMRIPVINRGGECFIFCFLSKGISTWIKTEREYRLPIEKACPFEEVDPHRDYSIFK